MQHLHSEWRLLLPVTAFGVGCAVYIAGDTFMPNVWQLSMLLACGVVISTFRASLRHSVTQIVLMALLGLLIAAWRVESLDGPRLSGEIFAPVTGEVIRLERREGKSVRLTIKVEKADGRRQLPDLLRIGVRTQMPPDLHPGDIIQTKARLSPPRGAIAPGAYDFARRAYFEGIGGEGFAIAPVERVRGGNRAFSVAGLRDSLGTRIMSIMPGQEGAIVVALIVGDRQYLSEETASSFRDAGLAHLMAISGLHMALITGVAFFVLEYLFAAFPTLALRVPPRKLAAMAAWMIAACYLMLSGMGISTIRAFVMVTVGLLAVLLDRRVLSLRSVALAALAILLFWPEAVLMAGFQMSFAATAALVVFYEKLSSRWPQTRGRGPIRRIGVFLAMTALTTLVAEAAVAPFSLYHFQAISLVGLGANLIVIPIVSIVVMPLAMAMLILMPFSLDGLIAPLLAHALGIALDTAKFFSSSGLAVAHIEQPVPAFLAIAGGGFVLGITLVGRARLLVVMGAVLLLAAGDFSSKPNLLIDNEGRVIAAAANEGGYHIVGGRRDGFRDENWGRYWGQAPTGPPEQLRRRCDAGGCSVTLLDGRQIVVAEDIGSMRRACAGADVVVLPKRWSRYCRGRALQISKEDLAEMGPAGIDLKSREVYWSNGHGKRPWQTPEP